VPIPKRSEGPRSASNASKMDTARRCLTQTRRIEKDPLVCLRQPPCLVHVPEHTGVTMSNLSWLTDELMERVEPFFPKSHGKPRVDDRRVLIGRIFINHNRLL
jgi:hypothetical protein